VTATAIAPPIIVFRNRRAGMRARRAVDIVIASVALVACLPILVVAAIAILIEDGAPVFFSQRRVGRYERTFSIYKLRSMRREACRDARTPSSSEDARISRVGRFIRRTSIDELPQLFNVIRGDMALVGPRPEMPLITRQYQNWQHLRHLVLPGITGIWQTRQRGTIALDAPEATLSDLIYVRNASALLDGLLLVLTLHAVLRKKGAC
jgi:lipopolysaccharide/colanic/teichoic acid biosynthesis glycosyltransferase